jgi:hypothetical protein
MFKKYMNDYKYLLGTAFCSVVIISIIKKKFLSNNIENGDKRNRNRRISFNSQAMIHGAFPNEAKVLPI